MKNKNELVRRSYLCEVRATQDDERGVAHIVGHPIVYNSRTDLGYFDEVIAAGALDKTDMKDVRFLVNHNLSMIPLARSRRNNGNSTMHLIQDENGLEMHADIDIKNNADARTLASAIERGDISGMSFMFTIDGESWEDLESEHPTRTITEIGTIVELSAVTFPAYESTDISARDTQEALDSARKALESARQARADAVDTASKKAETSDDLALAKAKFEALFI